MKAAVMLPAILLVGGLITTAQAAEETSLEVGHFTMFDEEGLYLAGVTGINDNLRVRLQAADWFDYYVNGSAEYQFSNGAFLLAGYRSQKAGDFKESGLFAGVGYEYNVTDNSAITLAYKRQDVWDGINTISFLYSYAMTPNWHFLFNAELNSNIRDEQSIGIRYRF